jgi:hypothetical protein
MGLKPSQERQDSEWRIRQGQTAFADQSDRTEQKVAALKARRNNETHSDAPVPERNPFTTTACRAGFLQDAAESDSLVMEEAETIRAEMRDVKPHDVQIRSKKRDVASVLDAGNPAGPRNDSDRASLHRQRTTASRSFHRRSDSGEPPVSQRQFLLPFFEHERRARHVHLPRKSRPRVVL